VMVNVVSLTLAIRKSYKLDWSLQNPTTPIILPHCKYPFTADR